ncbi:MAG TPA: metallophosphoesterase [Caulobacteraceae bacterium]|nr:metallophosphoesterase [Caulobacteraceae bacterium]
MTFLKRIIRAKPQPPAPRSRTSELVYAIGDVHGRLDCLEPLLDAIRADAQAHAVRPRLIFLGDLVDRGPESRQVVDRVLELSIQGWCDVDALKGNHEEALLLFLEEPPFGATWGDHGGGPTMLSYGVAPPRTRTDDEAWTAARDAFAAALPDEHLAFYKALKLWTVSDDYLFVHAGVRPGTPIERQEEADLLWIRAPFLEVERASDKVVVHGHTPSEQVEMTPWRIGTDTGAYATGLLSAVKLHGTERRLIQARPSRARRLA